MAFLQKIHEWMPKMKAVLLSVAVACVAVVPMAATAQDENVNCEAYLAMDSASQLLAIDAALMKSAERGSGQRFGADASDSEKLDYMQAACTESAESPTIDLIDMLGE
jgi:hypothetical protein